MRRGQVAFLGGLLDFLAAGTIFFLVVEQHFFFVAGGRRDLLSQTHETGKERIRSSAESKASSHVEDLHVIQAKHH